MSEKSLEERKKEFLEKYKELRDEYQLDFASFPQFIPSPNGICGVGVMTDLVDLTTLPKEDFIPKSNETIQENKG